MTEHTMERRARPIVATLSAWALHMGLLWSVACPTPTVAQTAFPSQPLKLVIAFGPGGVADTTSRLVADKLGEKLGQRVVVENNPSGGGVTAARNVINAAADGHTLALLTNGNAIAAGLFKSLAYNVATDFAAVSKLGAFEFFVATRAESPFKTLDQFITAAKAAPGKFNMAAVNPGSSQHLTELLLRSAAGIDVQFVPFRTSTDLIVALLRGDIEIAVDAYVVMKGNLEDGKVRALATSAAKRSTLLPDVPSVTETAAKGFDVSAWNGIFVKAGTPPAIIATLNAAIRAALADDNLKKKMLDLGIVAEATSPEDMTALYKTDAARWADVIDKNKLEKQ